MFPRSVSASKQNTDIEEVIGQSTHTAFGPNVTRDLSKRYRKRLEKPVELKGIASNRVGSSPTMINGAAGALPGVIY
ncbi:hypothetical protein CDAR_198701 [Caerostris darwini]|uniref:Uncharacterized protein n=1 Tax=Caerostris darwini TaxID=1538125 RepID=A0AAV4W6J3_9ARAC|nr:hypothetical protein CDAR_198701 [Caerostris darwini]